MSMLCATIIRDLTLAPAKLDTQEMEKLALVNNKYKLLSYFQKSKLPKISPQTSWKQIPSISLTHGGYSAFHLDKIKFLLLFTDGGFSKFISLRTERSLFCFTLSYQFLKSAIGLF